MKVAAKDATSLDHLTQSLKSSGRQAELTSGNTTGAGYEGRILLRGK
jgi:hypothetical protein